MSARENGLKVIHSNTGHGTGEPRTSRLRIIAAVVGLAVLLVGGAQWSQRDPALAQNAASQPAAEAQNEPTAFEYFPAPYVNQAKEVEEHIEAF